MADSNASSAVLESDSQQPDSGHPLNQSDPATTSQPSGPQQPSSAPPTVPNANPNPNPQVLSIPTQPPATFSYAPSQVSSVVAAPQAAPSFRPVPQFSPVPTLNYQSPALQPPGVGSASPMAPGVAIAGAGAVPVSQHQSHPLMAYQIQGQPPNQALRHFAPILNGYAALPPGPLGALNPMGIPRYPTPYGTVVRPIYPPRPLGTTGVLPTMRPPVVPVPSVRPFIASAVRPVVAPSITAEKPQTTVYVGKIAPSVENDFILSLLQLCGPIKNWKRAQNPSDGTYISFGFCEFESAEGVLRALRLLSRFKIDGQELVMNVDQATREYLERYVEKKTENFKKLKEAPGAVVTKNDENAQTAVSNDSGNPSIEDAKKKEDNKLANKDISDSSIFGVVTDEDEEADQVALDKLTNMIEERLKTKPLPPPPPPSQAVIDASGNSNEVPAKSIEGDSDTFKNVEDKNEDEANSDKPTSENGRRESSPDRNRRNDRRSREHDRERDLKREKEREIEKYEREAERERYRKEREQRRKMEEAERYYEECLKEWEYREKDKEKQRQYEKEREKERERKRKKEILNDEDDETDDSRKRWRKSVLEEKRKKRLREKEDDLTDRDNEEQEIVEAKRKVEEEQKQKHKEMFKPSTNHLLNGDEKPVVGIEVTNENRDKAIGNNTVVNTNHESHIDDANLVSGIKDESIMASDGASDARQGGIAPAKKLGFGLVGSGRRAAVASVFHEDDDDDAEKDKKMRPLVPIDYSNEELQVVQSTAAGAAPQNSVAAVAAEFAKRISNANIKEEKYEKDMDRYSRSYEKRDRERTVDDGARSRNEIKERLTERVKDRQYGLDKHKTSDNKKLLDAKQIIDLIPKTKEELFSYNINWSVYDKNQLHKRMRPWISKKITEFLGEEETTLVDYIVSSTQEHVKASQMLELLQSILDEEAEMFVLKMWRMLIFEIKKVETGLESKSK